MLELFGLLLGSLREFSVDILFHDKSADGHTIGSTPAAILHIDGNGNLRIIHGCKTHEYGVVVAAVLCRTRLATGHEVVLGEFVARTTCCGGSHALNDIVVGSLRRLGMAWMRVERIDEPATVGDGSAKVGYLQRCGVDLTLSDGNRNNGQTVPRTLVGLVVELCIGNQAALLARQVDAHSRQAGRCPTYSQSPC